LRTSGGLQRRATFTDVANTFLVALFTFCILWRLLTRHLAAIARSVSD
jgi:hypothetical protein